MAGISVSISSTSGDINLTALGGADYLAGQQSVALGDGYKKTGGGGLISASATYGSGYTLDQEDKYALTITTTDSTPSNVSANPWKNRLYTTTVGTEAYITINLPASTQTRTAKVYFQVFTSGSVLNTFTFGATLSDSSASPYSSTVSASASWADTIFVADIEYSAAAASQTLAVVIKMVDTSPTVDIRAIHHVATWVSSPAAGGNTLQPSLFTNTNTFYSPTISTIIGLVAGLFTNTNTFYSHIISTGGNKVLSPGTFPSANAFFTHQLTTAGGAISTPTVSQNGEFITIAFTTTAAHRAGVDFGLSSSLFGMAVVEDAGTTATSHSIVLEASDVISTSPHQLVVGQTYYVRAVAGAGGTLVSDTVSFTVGSLSGGTKTLSPGILGNNNSFYSAVLSTTGGSGSGALISATIDVQAAAVNLTALGSEDYLIYRQGQPVNSGYRKSTGGSLITVDHYDPNGVYQYDEEEKGIRPYSSTDANPTLSGTSVWNRRVVVAGLGTTHRAGGISVTLPAGTGQRTAYIYVMGYAGNPATNTFSAIISLSDGSYSTQTINYTGNPYSDNFLRISVTYYAANAGQTLNVIFRANEVATSDAALRAVHFGAAWVSPATASIRYLTPTLLPSTNTFFAHTVIDDKILYPNILDSSNNTFYSHSLTFKFNQTLTTTLVDSNNIFPSHTILTPNVVQNLSGGYLFENSSTFYRAVVVNVDPYGISNNIRKLYPTGIVELFELDTSTISGAGGIDRFYCGTNEFTQNIIWNGNVYAALPITVEGYETTGNGASPRPRAKIANIKGIVTAYNKAFANLLGAKVTRIRTFVKFLDPENFLEGNPTADPTQELPRDVYFIDRKVSENRIFAEYELAAAWDVVQFLPRRPVIQNSCFWLYRGPECGYSGSAVADIYDNPITDISKDMCSHRLDGCKLRFGENAELPFGGFPGAGQ